MTIKKCDKCKKELKCEDVTKIRIGTIADFTWAFDFLEFDLCEDCKNEVLDKLTWKR